MMSVCSRIRTFATRSLHSIGSCSNLRRNYTSRIMSSAPSNFCCLTLKAGSSGKRYSRVSVSQSTSSSSSSSCSLQIFHRMYTRSVLSKKKRNYPLLANRSSSNHSGTQEARVDYSFGCQNGSIRVSSPRRGVVSTLKCNAGPLSWSYKRASAGLMFGLLVCYSSSDYSYAEPPRNRNDKLCDEKSSQMSHGKIVHTDYSVIGIPGDGRCLFRSVVHGACLRSGKAAPSENLQRELADELRDRVADEFIKRRQETEWFIEGDFDTYVAQMRKPHVWGGEPELLMLSHVLTMPITVYMRDESSGGLISIAEYGQEYGKDNPIRVLYHGFGHYDALLIPGKKVTKSRL